MQKCQKNTILSILSLFLWRICTKRYYFILYLQIRSPKENFDTEKSKIERLVRAQYRAKVKLENFEFDPQIIQHSMHNEKLNNKCENQPNRRTPRNTDFDSY